jgi:hypothetical protein
MIKPMGIYKQNKKAQAKQKKIEGLQVIAAVMIFYAIVYITGLQPII